VREKDRALAIRIVAPKRLTPVKAGSPMKAGDQ